MGRKVAWFSCGAASAVAAKLCEPDEVVYCDTLASEHPDNARFMREVEAWLGIKVRVIRNPDYASVDEVFERTRFMSGIAGARCTVEMKKVPRFLFQIPDDVHVFGYTVDERKRADRMERTNPELLFAWPLIEHGLTKADCLDVIQKAGIELPAMYRMGYKNNNCLGCVKATSPAYWNKIRQDFPAAWERRAAQSRILGVRLARVKGVRVFLDEVPLASVESVDEDLSCGPLCGVDETRALREGE